jgi:hypothetical protein
MSQVISLRNERHKRSDARSCPPTRIDRSEPVAALVLVSGTPPDNEDIDRAIMLLDAAAEHARLVVMQASGPTSGTRIETQTASIVQLLVLARSVTSRLG